MKLKLKFLKPFSDVIGKSELKEEYDVNYLEDLLKVIIDKYPKLKKEFFTNDDKLTDYICIFVNDKPISALNGLMTKLNTDDELLFFIPISGG
jgi:MoaD family protein